MREDANTLELVDICTVSVDRTLSKRERIIEFIKRIKNPYRFRCKEFIVTVRYSTNGPSFEECLEQVMT